jgi:hypothetical protein
VKWHQEYPDDWKKNWQLIEDKWGEDVGCPDGVHRDFNIDAKINAAYVVLGLLYGDGDLARTMEISTRAGQDSDCNPASSGAIIGTIAGYKNIPEYWSKGLALIEDMDFKYTSTSLNDAYEISYRHALEMILKAHPHAVCQHWSDQCSLLMCICHVKWYGSGKLYLQY